MTNYPFRKNSIFLNINICLPPSFLCGIKRCWSEFLFIWKWLFSCFCNFSLFICYLLIAVVFTVNYLKPVSLFWGILNVVKPSVYKSRFSMTNVFLTTACSYWQMAAATSVVCKTDVSPERMVRAVACLTIINKTCLIIIYKMIVWDCIQNLFDWFYQYVLPCCCHQQHNISGVCRHYKLI